MDIRKMLGGIDIEKTLKVGVSAVKDNLPAIFAASAIGCLVLGAVETVVATHKSDEDIAKEEARRTEALPLYDNVKLTTQEKIQLCWKNYTKAAFYDAAAICFIIASERKGNEKYLALMSAYELSRQANGSGEERKAAELDILGEEKTSEIDKAVRQRRVKEIVSSSSDIQETPSTDGRKTLYVEYYTNTPFWATYEEVLHAFNYVNHKKNNEGSASINDLLEDLGLRKMLVAENWGWNRDQGLVEPLLDEPMFVDDDPTKPATTILYDIEPSENFGNDYYCV